MTERPSTITCPHRGHRTGRDRASSGRAGSCGGELIAHAPLPVVGLEGRPPSWASHAPDGRLGLAAVLIFIMVGGTLWIMLDLNARMMG